MKNGKTTSLKRKHLPMTAPKRFKGKNNRTKRARETLLKKRKFIINRVFMIFLEMRQNARRRVQEVGSDYR